MFINSNRRVAGKVRKAKSSAPISRKSKTSRKPTLSAEKSIDPSTWNNVRPEKVARAKKLIRRKSYPSKKVLDSLANLLARHL